ncbi:hypothetical protein BGZ99_007281, partial [Dissophora globulifera]
AYILKTAIRHVFGRTPKGQLLPEGITSQILTLIMGDKIFNVAQSRAMMSESNKTVHAKNGTLAQADKDKWALKVEGQGWNGFWIPYKDQSSEERLKADLEKKLSPVDVGAGCDIVMFAIHGGGMIYGEALMFLSNYRSWMKELQVNHKIKIGFLSVEYSLAPETPYPGALNECVAAYKHLVEYYGVDPRRIVMCGDSAGANLCLTSVLKLRDDSPHINLPAGQVLISPWVMCPKPVKTSPHDYITTNGLCLFMDAYTQGQTEALTSPYVSPIGAPTLKGMPRMMIFIGGVETLRPSIEDFIQKATADGVDVQYEVKQGKVHDYALIEEVAGAKTVQEATQSIGRFVAQTQERYTGVSGPR